MSTFRRRSAAAIVVLATAIGVATVATPEADAEAAPVPAAPVDVERPDFADTDSIEEPPASSELPTSEPSTSEQAVVTDQPPVSPVDVERPESTDAASVTEPPASTASQIGEPEMVSDRPAGSTADPEPSSTVEDPGVNAASSPDAPSATDAEVSVDGPPTTDASAGTADEDAVEVTSVPPQAAPDEQSQPVATPLTSPVPDGTALDAAQASAVVDASVLASPYAVDGICVSQVFRIKISTDVDAQFVVEGSAYGTYTVRSGQAALTIVPEDQNGDGSIRVVPKVAGWARPAIHVDVLDCIPPNPLAVRGFCQGSDFTIELTSGSVDKDAEVEGYGRLLLPVGQPQKVRPQDIGGRYSNMDARDGWITILLYKPGMNSNNPAGWKYVRVQLCPPSPPSGLTGSVAPQMGTRSGQVRLSWEAPEKTGGRQIRDYRIELSRNGTTWTTVNDGVSAAQAGVVSGLTNGTRYQFRVRAYNGSVVGKFSNVVVLKPRGTPPAPTALSAVVAPTRRVKSGQVRLTWQPPVSNGGEPITDYVLRRSTDGVNWTRIADGTGASRSYTVSRLTNGRLYRFQVAAKNAFGVGTASTVNATPRTVPSKPQPIAEPASHVVRLTWTAPSSGGFAIKDYIVQRSANGTKWTMVRDGISTKLSSTVRDLTNGHRYYFRVAARNIVGTSRFSRTVVATPHTVPSAPDLRYARNGISWITWDAPESGGSPIVDYKIQKWNSWYGWHTLRDGRSTNRSITVSRYCGYYRVAAVNAAGTGPYSDYLGWSC